MLVEFQLHKSKEYGDKFGKVCQIYEQILPLKCTLKMVKMINFMSNIHTTRKNNRINTAKNLNTYMTQGTIISEMS